MKNILLLGTGGGIGQAFLRDIVTWADNVISSSRSQLAEIWNEKWGEVPKNLHHFPFDLTKEENIIDLFTKANEICGTINIVINTIGGSLYTHTIEDFPMDEFDRVFSLNLRTAFMITKHAIKNIKLNENGGNILHIVSSSAKIQSHNKAPYGIAKSGVARLIQYAAAENAQNDIRVNGITPTYVFTERHNSQLKNKAEKTGKDIKELDQQAMRRQLIKRKLDPEGLVPVMKLLATTKIITAQIYNVTLGEVISY